MASRLYFPETEAAAVSPTISATDWEHINTLRRRLLTSPDSSTLTTTAYTPDAADHLVNGDAHHRQYVSDPLPAQNISGSVKAQFQCLEANAANNLFLTLKIFVVSEDGATIKETLLAITRDSTNELATSLTNRNFPSTALTAADIEEGDRIVVEVGLGGTPTAAGGTQGHNGSLRWGCNASGGDLAENDTETGTTFRPWIEFTDNINQRLTGTGAIASAEAFGAAKISLGIAPPSIASAEGFGGQKINLNLAPSAIASGEAFGSHTVSVAGGGAQTISPSAIASAEAFGTAVLRLFLLPSGIASAEAFGAPMVNLRLFAAAVASAEAFGTALLRLAIAPPSIASGEAFGAPKLNLRLLLAAIASAEAFGSPVVSVSGGPQIIAPGGITSAEVFGTAMLRRSILASGIASLEAFGSARMMLWILAQAIASLEAFGTATITGGDILEPGVDSFTVRPHATSFPTPARQASIAARGRRTSFTVTP